MDLASDGPRSARVGAAKIQFSRVLDPVFAGPAGVVFDSTRGAARRIRSRVNVTPGEGGEVMPGAYCSQTVPREEAGVPLARPGTVLSWESRSQVPFGLAAR